MSSIAADLPPEITDRSAWYGPDMARRNDWVEFLSDAELVEVVDNARRLAASGREIGQLSAADFPLPRLAPRLAAITDEVLNGRGFALLRGLPMDRLSYREAATAYFGIGAHVGAARSQNAKGHVLGHVRDLGLSSKDPNVRIYQTSERQTYHTDSCDIVALLCVRPAKSGGLSALVSATTMWNEMRRARPDLAHELLQPMAHDRRGEVPPGQKPYYMMPVWSWYLGLLTVFHQRQYWDSAQRFADAPRLTPRQVEALDMFDALANDPRLHMFMEFRPGDIQLVHNHSLLHDRTAFEDWPEPERRRHLLRLWLAPRGARPLPPHFAQRFGSLAPGERGGIMIEGTRLNAPLEA